MLRLAVVGALLLLRSICWATVGAAGLTALAMWLASKETPIMPDIRYSVFTITWCLVFIPSFVAELLNAHLGTELGPDS